MCMEEHGQVWMFVVRFSLSYAEGDQRQNRYYIGDSGSFQVKVSSTGQGVQGADV